MPPSLYLGTCHLQCFIEAIHDRAVITMQAQQTRCDRARLPSTCGLILGQWCYGRSNDRYRSRNGREKINAIEQYLRPLLYSLSEQLSR